jgi:hypothetical protein
MTTVQESPNGNGHRLFPPPFFVENAVELNRADLPTDKANNNSHTDTNQLPDRCQFSFSDGRQCTMARSDIHPSLCRFHAEREDQLFGDPSPAGCVVGRALDLPELYSACRDLNTAAGVNRALTLVFRLLAQRRISRQEAATFGHLAQLLLRTISLMRAESADPIRSSAESDHPTSPSGKGYPPAAKVYQQDELSPLNKGALFADNKVELSPLNEVPATTDPIRSPINGTSTTPIAPPPRSEPPAKSTAAKTSSGMDTCGDLVCNSSEISTYKNAGFEPAQNQQLQKSGPGGHGRERHGHQELRGVNKVGGISVAQVVLPAHSRREERGPRRGPISPVLGCQT